jgi:hypothetical protein
MYDGLVLPFVGFLIRLSLGDVATVLDCRNIYRRYCRGDYNEVVVKTLMNMPYEYHESHKHKLAKETLFKWLDNIEKGIPNTPPVRLPFYWRRPNYGVHLELPFYSNSDPYYFECSGHENDGGEQPGRILFVPDITIFHKGSVKIIIEVVHKNIISGEKEKKINSFFGDGVWLYSIEADNILNQTNKHCNLFFEPISYRAFTCHEESVDGKFIPMKFPA